MNNRWVELIMKKWGVSWFKMNEDSGNILDSNGILIGTPYNLMHQQDNGINFNGTNSYCLLNNKAVLVGKKSIYFEIQTSQVTDHAIIMTQCNGAAGNGIQISLNTNGGISFMIGKSVANTPLIPSITSRPINDGLWHKVLITWDGTTSKNGVKMYIDDLVNPSNMTTSTGEETLVPTSNLSIGRGTVAPWYYFNGNLRNIQIYSDVIDQIEKYNLIKSDNKYYTYYNNEVIELEPTVENFIKYNIDLSILTESTSKTVLPMEEKGILEKGKEYKKIISVNKYKDIKNINVL